MFDGRKAEVLIVDDNRLNRKKLSLAVEALGYAPTVAANGVEALECLRKRAFDAVLLDLLMPEMDGFDVMAHLKDETDLRDIPIIVISDLEGEPESVSRAIEMGAEDFLPKGFEPIILNARLKASLRKKEFRDQELEYFRRVGTLTKAAALVQSGEFDESGIADLKAESAKTDPIGQLARVFSGMASEIHAREVRLLERIRFLQGSFLLIVCGATIALNPSLSRLAAGFGSTPLGMIFWVDICAMLLCFSVVLSRGKFPKLTRSDWAFFAAWAFMVGIIQHGTIFFFAERLEATYITMLLAFSSIMVFAISAALRFETAQPKRIVGVLIGLTGIGLGLYERLDGGSVLWLLLALSIPLIYALEVIVLASRRPQHIDAATSIGLMFGISALFALPLALVTGEFLPAASLISNLGLTILLLASCTCVANLALIVLIDLTGPIFASQVNYVSAIFGIFWGLLLLGERLSFVAWFAMGIVVFGVFLVGTKASDKPIKIKRDYGG